MSVEAISWALNLAPVPADRGGQPSSACKFVLVGLANHAGPDGSGAFPSVATLVRYTGLAERTVRTCLHRLAAAGIIAPCDPGIVAARIKRADRRPQGWDLNLSLIREDLAEDDDAPPDRPPAASTRAATAGRAGPDEPNGMQPLHLVPGTGPVDNWPDGVQQPHPEPGTGCNQRSHGVQPAQSRGAAVAPEPSLEPSMEPAAPAHAREVPPDALAGAAGGGEPVSGFFAALGGRWRLTATQRARLAPAVTAALAAGWTPPALAAFTGANTSGVRNPYAVLATRLSQAELPPPARSPRPAWCGECDQATRMLDFHGNTPRPCPRCKPAATASRTKSRRATWPKPGPIPPDHA
ncbi:MAG TPA: helix-turn-helix domain-containing protein [Streptosporangiaceae bacterium]